MRRLSESAIHPAPLFALPVLVRPQQPPAARHEPRRRPNRTSKIPDRRKQKEPDDLGSARRLTASMRLLTSCAPLPVSPSTGPLRPWLYHARCPLRPSCKTFTDARAAMRYQRHRGTPRQPQLRDFSSAASGGTYQNLGGTLRSHAYNLRACAAYLAPRPIGPSRAHRGDCCHNEIVARAII